MRIVGLTGGIGSGKSTIAKEFEKLGVPIFIADEASKKILAQEETVRNAVINLLGSEAYAINEKGMLLPDKKFIASKVFADKSLLQGLNDILHPAVRKYFNNWLDQQKAPYIIYEAAILLESGGHELCDQVILVTASRSEKLRRVMLRDGVTRQEVLDRMSHQWSDIKRLNLSDFVIINENIQNIEGFIKNIHDVLLKS